MSNQVYSDLQSKIPFNSPLYATQFTLTASGGIGTPTGNIGVQLYRINPGQAMFAIVGATTSAWADALILSAPAGTVPVAFRPTVDQYVHIYFSRAAGVSVDARLFISGVDGSISISKYTTAGVAIVIPNGDTIAPCAFVYPIAFPT